jgi:diguanylate cyclase (GGDEF)-like protein/PAS domain S-box-containing protein
MKLLIITANRSSQLLLTALTQKWGYDSIAVENCIVASKVITQNNLPSLVLIDGAMIETQGFEVLNEIRLINNTPTPYMIMLTHGDNIKGISNALALGVNDFALKPINDEDLSSRLAVGAQALKTSQAKSDIRSTTGLNHERFFERSADAFLLYQNGRYVDCNQAAVDMLGYDCKRDILDAHPAEISAPTQPYISNPIKTSSGIIAKAFNQGSHRFKWDYLCKNGQVLHAEVLLSSALINDQKGLHISWRDITKHSIEQEQLKSLAYYDVLTKLPNRALFDDRFIQAVAHSKRTKTLLAVCFLDLDDFKTINDNYGHGVGDQVLIEAAERIKQSVREGDTVSRQGGDEFTLLLGSIENTVQAKHILERMLDSLSKPYLVGGRTHCITASCGVSIKQDHNKKLGELVGQADQAMYQAKRKGKNQYAFYDHGVKQPV